MKKLSDNLKIRKWINANRPFITEALKHAVDTNSWTLNQKGVNSVSKYLLSKFLDKRYWKITKYNSKNSGNLYIAEPKKRSDSSQKVMLCGHSDTVFPSNQQKTRLTDGVMEGPGTCDMKGGLVTYLAAVKCITSLYKKAPNADIFLVPDEEVGSYHFKETLYDKYKKSYKLALVFEGCGDNEEVVVKRKGVLQLQIDSFGESGHSGYDVDKKVNAILNLSKALISIAKLNNSKAKISVNVGTISGGTQPNVIPSYAYAKVDVRSFKKSMLSKTRIRIENISKKYACLSKELINIPPMDDQKTKAKKYINSLQESFNVVGIKFGTEERGGGSDANQIATFAIPVIDGLGPQGNGAHTEKEFVLMKSIMQRIELLASFLEKDFLN